MNVFTQIQNIAAERAQMIAPAAEPFKVGLRMLAKEITVSYNTRSEERMFLSAKLDTDKKGNAVFKISRKSDNLGDTIKADRVATPEEVVAAFSLILGTCYADIEAEQEAREEAAEEVVLEGTPGKGRSHAVDTTGAVSLDNASQSLEQLADRLMLCQLRIDQMVEELGAMPEAHLRECLIEEGFTEYEISAVLEDEGEAPLQTQPEPPKAKPAKKADKAKATPEEKAEARIALYPEAKQARIRETLASEADQSDKLDTLTALYCRAVDVEVWLGVGTAAVYKRQAAWGIKWSKALMMDPEAVAVKPETAEAPAAAEEPKA